METVAMYLVAALVGGIVATLLRLPPMVGFLAAGFALYALGVPEMESLELVAELGVTLLLFAIGLKLDLKSLVRPEVWLTTAAHMLLSVAIGTAFLGLIAALGMSLLDGVPLQTLALIAFALSFSSTVFVVKVLEERSDATAMYGRIAIGVLVLQDIGAVVFLVIAHGELPSPWALSLVLLIPFSWLIRKFWDRLGHGELQVLFGVVMALVPGYALFELVGLRGDLGALVMGVLLATHPRSGELGHELLSLKDILLVGFFLSIGLTGIPSLQALGLSALLLLLLPVQTVLYLALFRLMRMRHRTSMLAALVLFNYSEFGLIVIAGSAGLVSDDWLTMMAVAVAASFVIGATLNKSGVRLAAWWARILPRQDPARLVSTDRPIALGNTEAVVLGMGRVGRAAYLRLRDHYKLEVVGVEHDDLRAAELAKHGMHVLHADATDREFWERVNDAAGVRIAVLAMPFHSSNIDALELLRESGFDGVVTAVAMYDDDATELSRKGANSVFHLYGSAGTALADAATPTAAPASSASEAGNSVKHKTVGKRDDSARDAGTGTSESGA